MRVGILSDVHGNLAGFDAALTAMGPVDALLFGGDLLGYYFDAVAVMDRLRQLGAECILGNHDAYFLSHLGYDTEPRIAVPAPEAYRLRYGPALDRAARELSGEDIAWLRALPACKRLDLGGARLLMAHGSPWRPLDEYVYPDHGDFERFGALDVDVVIMGHTHRPLLRTVGSVTLLNPGSCGQPRDRDARAAFAIATIDRGVRCELGRAAYDRGPLLERCRTLAPSVPLLTELLMRDA